MIRLKLHKDWYFFVLPNVDVTWKLAWENITPTRIDQNNNFYIFKKTNSLQG